MSRDTQPQVGEPLRGLVTRKSSSRSSSSHKNGRGHKGKSAAEAIKAKQKEAVLDKQIVKGLQVCTDSLLESLWNFSNRSTGAMERNITQLNEFNATRLQQELDMSPGLQLLIARRGFDPHAFLATYFECLAAHRCARLGMYVTSGMLECRAVVKELYDQTVRHTRTKRVFLYNNNNMSSSSSIGEDGDSRLGSEAPLNESAADCWNATASSAGATTTTSTSLDGQSLSTATQRIWKTVVQPRKASKVGDQFENKSHRHAHKQHSSASLDKASTPPKRHTRGSSRHDGGDRMRQTSSDKTATDASSLSNTNNNNNSESTSRDKPRTSKKHGNPNQLMHSDFNNSNGNGITTDSGGGSSVLSTLQPVRTMRGNVAASVTDIIISRAAGRSSRRNTKSKHNNNHSTTETSVSGTASRGLTKRHLADLIQQPQGEVIPSKPSSESALGVRTSLLRSSSKPVSESAFGAKPSLLRGSSTPADAQRQQHQFHVQRQATGIAADLAAGSALPQGEALAKHRHSQSGSSSNNNDTNNAFADALTSLRVTTPVEAFQPTLLRGPHGVLSVRLPTGSNGSKSACELLFRPKKQGRESLQL